MRFNPDVKDKSHLLPEGEHDFEIINASEKESASGNEMMVLKLRIGVNGASKTVTDYILASNVRKVRSVAKCCDLLDIFETGEMIPEQLIGRQGRAKLVIEKGTKNFPDRNVVNAYLSGKKLVRS